MCGSPRTGVAHLAEICMRLSAPDECVADAVLDLAATLGWGDVRVDAGQAIFVRGAVTSALVFGADPLTQAT